MEDQSKQSNNADTTPKVTGIGGVFFIQTTLKKLKIGMPKI